MILNLSKKYCEACNGNTNPLSGIEILEYLKELNSWSVNDESEMIFKKFEFKNFKEACNFSNLVAKLSEDEGHHPDISLGWGYCIIMLHTHSIKNLSINDFIMASKIDLI